MHKHTLHLKLIAGLLLTLTFGPVLMAGAQPSSQTGQPTVFINEVKVSQPVEELPGIEGLQLDVTFTLLDAEGQIMVGDSRIAENGVEFVLDSGTPFVVSAQPPIGSFTIVVLIDSSATMANFRAGPDFKNMKDAITIALGQGPEGATYMVRQFHDTAPLVLGFTQSQEELGKKIKAITAKQGGKSCLLNGVDQALTDLSTVAGRKAVLVVTASADTCAQKTPQDIVDRARQLGVQVYGVGMKGYTITDELMDVFTHPSGGLNVSENIGEFGFGLSHILAALKSQWQANAIMYPKNGPQLAAMTVTLQGGTKVVAPEIPFSATKDYIEPPRVELKGQVLSYNGGIKFNLDITSREKITELALTVTDIISGLESVEGLALAEFGEQNEVDIPNLEVGKAYRLTIIPKGERGVEFQGAEAEFQYAPPPPTISIEKLDTPTLEKPEFALEIQTENLEEAVKFQLFLRTEQATQPMPDTLRTIPVGEKLVLVVPESLPDGNYQVVIVALDATDKALADAGTQLVPYHKPTAVERLVAFLRTNPLGLIGITAVCCVAFIGLAAVVWLIIPKPSSGPKQVDLVVPEKRRSAAPITNSGIFGPSDASPPPPRPSRAAPPPPPPPSPEPRAEPAAANLPRAWFTAKSQTSVIGLTYITRSPFTIGRRDSNDLVVKVDNSAGVSGQHATITFADGRFYLQDDRSTYGTTVNGKSTPKAMPVPLENGVVIGLGPKVTIQFHQE